jgi:hypothetical protein
MLYRGKLPLLLNEQTLLELLNPTSEKRMLEHGLLPNDALCKFCDAWENSTIVASNLNKEAHKRIKNYLKEKQPRKQLKEMEELSVKLHSTLKSHFDISQILMTAADLKKRGYYHL